MDRYLLFALALLTLCGGVSCSKVPIVYSNTKIVNNLQFINKDGVLSTLNPKNNCILADDAIDYEAFVSPDKNFVAVETLLISNIQILRVYKKDINDCYLSPNASISKYLWQNISQKNEFNIEGVIHPRIKFLRWINNDSIEVQLSGEINTKEFNEHIDYDLRKLF